MQLPLGQSVAPFAEQWPSQLAPWPHVTLVNVLSGAQQLTWIDWLEKVNDVSNKTLSVVLAVQVVLAIVVLGGAEEDVGVLAVVEAGVVIVVVEGDPLMASLLIDCFLPLFLNFPSTVQLCWVTKETLTPLHLDFLGVQFGTIFETALQSTLNVVLIVHWYLTSLHSTGPMLKVSTMKGDAVAILVVVRVVVVISCGPLMLSPLIDCFLPLLLNLPVTTHLLEVSIDTGTLLTHFAVFGVHFGFTFKTEPQSSLYVTTILHLNFTFPHVTLPIFTVSTLKVAESSTRSSREVTAKRRPKTKSFIPIALRFKNDSQLCVSA